GSIAWPAKPGRVAEMTCVHALKKPGAASYRVEHLEQQFAAPALEIVAPAPIRAHKQPALVAADIGHSGGFDIGPIKDGRETKMRDMALAPFKQLSAQLGRAPTSEELFDVAWPQYQRAVRVNVEGKQDRGADEMMEKCVYTVQRFHEGRLPGMPTLEKAI